MNFCEWLIIVPNDFAISIRATFVKSLDFKRHSYCIDGAITIMEGSKKMSLCGLPNDVQYVTKSSNLTIQLFAILNGGQLTFRTEFDAAPYNRICKKASSDFSLVFQFIQ